MKNLKKFREHEKRPTEKEKSSGSDGSDGGDQD